MGKNKLSNVLVYISNGCYYIDHWKQSCALIFYFSFISSSLSFLDACFLFALIARRHQTKKILNKFCNPRERSNDVQNGNCKHILIYAWAQSVPRLNIDRVSICVRRKQEFSKLYPELKVSNTLSFPV